MSDRATSGRANTQAKLRGAVSRRDVVRALAAAGAASAFTWTPDEVARAAEHALRPNLDSTRQGAVPRFFTAHEWDTVRLLVDLVIPRDERSGSATDAGVPEFMDFIMLDGDNERRQTAMRGGLAWLDIECRERFDADFVSCTTQQRIAVLDDIAYPDRTAPAYAQGAAFFTSFRNLTASGFWSSKMGVMDLQYIGNTALAQWTGCPADQLRKLGVDGG
ncbi:MAG TPA: gluconate 2-dehydrogenase subunit 3 family protein [Gemmatimonadales bacterium]|jgi:hypothetical protein